MKPTQKLHQAGQSLWLDNITRELLTTGALRSYIDDLDHGADIEPDDLRSRLLELDAYDDAIREAAEEGLAPEDVFFRLAIEDLQGAADLFRPVWDRTNGIDGCRWRCRRGSPATAGARWRPRPGSGRRPEGRTSSSRSPAPRGARCHRGGDLRRRAGERDPALQPRAVPRRGGRLHARRRAPGQGRARCAVGSVASVFVSRWDTSPEAKARPERERNALGIAQAKSGATPPTASCSICPAGAAGQRGAAAAAAVASTGTKDPEASDVLYVRALAAPLTVNTMPEKTSWPSATYGEVSDFLPADGGDAQRVTDRFTADGVDLEALAERLQAEGRPCSSRRGTSSCRPSRSARQPSRADGEPARDGPAWRALEEHHGRIGDLHLRDLFSEDLGHGERLVAEGAGLFLDYAKNRVTDETMALLVALAEDKRSGRADRGDVPRRADQRDRGPGRSASPRCARRGASASRSTASTSSRRCTRCSTAWRRSRTAAGRRVTGALWKLIRNVVNIGIGGSGPGAGDGLRGAAPLLAARHDVPLRLERRRHRLRRGDPGPSTPAETLFIIVSSKTFTTLETMTNAHGPRLGARRAGRRVRRREALRRGVDQRGRGCGSSASTRPTCSASGTGWAAATDGLGDRVIDDARHRAGGVLRDARRLLGQRRALPHDAAFERNLPVLMGLLAVWYGDFFGAQTVAVLPYARGTSCASRPISSSSRWSRTASGWTLEGAPVDYETGAVWSASRARTASIPSTSSSTRARS